MEGLFIVIAIVLGILDFVSKQQKKQGGSKRPQKPVQKQGNIPQSLRRAITELEKSLSEGMGDGVGEEPVLESFGNNEGIELEDRRKTGSLEYVEQNQSSEGICDEHPEHDRKNRNKKPAAYEAEPVEHKEGYVFDLTEENLLKSIVMAEVLGPPRAIKRRIR